MTNELYEHDCEQCGKRIRINTPADPHYCPWCGDKRYE